MLFGCLPLRLNSSLLLSFDIKINSFKQYETDILYHFYCILHRLLLLLHATVFLLPTQYISHFLQMQFKIYTLQKIHQLLDNLNFSISSGLQNEGNLNFVIPSNFICIFCYRCNPIQCLICILFLNKNYSVPRINHTSRTFYQPVFL